MENKMDLIITFCTAVVDFLKTFEKNYGIGNELGTFLNVLDSVQNLGYTPWYHLMTDMLCSDKYEEYRNRLTPNQRYILLDDYATASNIVNEGNVRSWNADMDYQLWMECTYFDEESIAYYERNRQYKHQAAVCRVLEDEED